MKDIKRPKKLTPVNSIKGMWNGVVFFKVIWAGETQTRVHVGLTDCDRIKRGESAEKVITEIISKHLHYKFEDIKILGVKPDRAMKKVTDPFSR
jgi:hypothetical protein